MQYQGNFDPSKKFAPLNFRRKKIALLKFSIHFIHVLLVAFWNFYILELWDIIEMMIAVKKNILLIETLRANKMFCKIFSIIQ